MMLRIKPRIVRARDGADSLCDIAKELVAGRSVALQFNWENLIWGQGSLDGLRLVRLLKLLAALLFGGAEMLNFSRRSA